MTPYQNAMNLLREEQRMTRKLIDENRALKAASAGHQQAIEANWRDGVMTGIVSTVMVMGSIMVGLFWLFGSVGG